MQPRSDVNKFDNKTFLKTVGTLGVPVIFQQLLTACLNMIDTVMVGGLGEISVAAVAVANKLVYVYSLVIFGLCTGLSIFVAQYYGAGEYKKIGKLSGFMYACVAGAGLVFTVVFAIFAPRLVGLFVEDTPEVVAKVVNEGAAYLRVICLSIIIMGLSFSLSSLCRGVRLTKLPLYATIISVLTNTGLNYVLIFGKFGFPALGVVGAAIATVIARLVEFALLVSIVYSKHNINPIRTSLKNMFGWSKDFVGRLMKTASPVVVNETLWGLAQTTYVAIIGILGASSVAVIQISTTVSSIFFSLSQGISVACSVMVGNAIGSGDFDYAEKCSRRFLIINLLCGAVCGLAVYLFKKEIISLFALEEATLPLMLKTLNVVSVTMWMSMLNNLFIVGIFRSGGDTKFCMVIEAGSLWLVGIPIMYYCVRHLNVSVYVAAALLQTDNFLKLFFSFPRFFSGKWMRRVISE